MLLPTTLRNIKDFTISLSPLLVSLPFTALDVNKFEKDDEKALWQPPGFVFGIVWPILYMLLFYMNYTIFKNPNISQNIKDVVARDTLIESGLQGSWLYAFRYKKDVGGRSKKQYTWSVILLLALLSFGIYRVFSLSMLTSQYTNSSYVWLYYPYFLWINFASLLGLQLYLGITK